LDYQERVEFLRCLAVDNLLPDFMAVGLFHLIRLAGRVKVTRSGKTNMVSVYDIMVGDILHLEAGDSIPAASLPCRR
jgi:hypothetical protein